jgi:hypothetical protein
VKDATTDLSQVAKWWQKWPTANIGIATGRVSGLVVVDVDPRNGGDDSFDALEEQHEGFPDTVVCLTGGGGKHLYYANPNGDVKLSAELADGIDLKSDGGYVVAPPSNHADGGTYWYDFDSTPENTGIAPLPEWITTKAAAATRDSPAANPTDQFTSLDPAEILTGVPVGERNDTVYRYMCRLRGKNLDRDEAYALGRQIVANSPPDPPFPETEMRRCLESAWKHPPGEAASIGVDLDRTTSRFTIVTGDEIESLPEPEWLIDGVLIQGSLVVLYGGPGTFKSFVALSMAGCISAGLQWQERETHQGTVIYVAAEGVGDLGVRVKAFRVANDLDSLPGVSYVLEPVNLFTDKASRGDADALAGQIGDLDPGLVIFDTLARSMAGGDENFAKDINSVIASADRLRHITGATVMLIHHAGHDPKRERGSSALKGAADTVIKQTAKDSTAKLTCDKQKTSAPFDPITVALAEYGDSLAVVSAPMTPELNDDLVACVRLVSLDGISHSEWKKAFTDAGLGAEKTFDRRRKALLDTGFVEKRAVGMRDRYFRTPAADYALIVTGIN